MSADPRPGLKGMNEQSRFNTTQLIAKLAGLGRDDPTIADRLGIKVSAVRTLRRAAGIEAGEQRWLGGAAGADHGR